MTQNDLSPFLIDCQTRIHDVLERYLPPLTPTPQRLHQAMHYAALNGGKRLRPLLVYATGTAFNTTLDHLDAPAAAIEYIHCYSLLHDDLPAMDDDDLRRGKLTCHKAFDEATAILAGDALQSLAFECLPSLEMVRILATAAGAYGMAGGQDLDLLAEGEALTLDALEMIHRLKTGALIEASVQLGAMAAGCSDTDLLNSLKKFGQQIGLAFQIHDDILDVEGDSSTLGKAPGADIRLEKATYPSIIGLIEAKARRQQLYESALQLLHTLPLSFKELEHLCQHIVNRHN